MMIIEYKPGIMSTLLNVDVIRSLLEFEPRAADGRELELTEPPTNDEGALICGRERRQSGGPCGNPVGIPWGMLRSA